MGPSIIIIKYRRHWKILPNGSGFLTMKEILGSPPNAVVLGCQAHIVSSTQIQGEQLTLVDLIKLNCSTVLENAHQGSLSFLLSSPKMLGKNLRKSLKWLNAINCSNCGLGQIKGHSLKLSSSVSKSFFVPNKSTPFWENYADPMIRPKPVRNSSLVNFLHLALAVSTAKFIAWTILVQSWNISSRNIWANTSLFL